MKHLLKYTEKLKHLPRSGWLHYNIETPETVAAHSWQMAMMAMQLSGISQKENYNFDKVIHMCLCHDLGESLIGDLTPRDHGYPDKHRQEIEAIDYIARDGNIPEIILLFEEYEKNQTPEAKLANDLDKLDMYAQSLAYEEKYPHLDLSEFRRSAEAKIQTELGLSILADLTNKA